MLLVHIYLLIIHLAFMESQSNPESEDIVLAIPVPVEEDINLVCISASVFVVLHCSIKYC